MQRRLPLKIDPVKAAQQRLDYQGIFPACLLRRLSDLAVSINKDIAASFSFHTDEERLPVIDIVADVNVILICQRCGRHFECSIHVKNALSPVRNDAEAAGLPDRYEAIMLNGLGEVDLVAMIEDEIILSLPIVPAHDMADCPVSETEWEFGTLPKEVQKSNPFAELKKLKKK